MLFVGCFFWAGSGGWWFWLFGGWGGGFVVLLRGRGLRHLELCCNFCNSSGAKKTPQLSVVWEEETLSVKVNEGTRKMPINLMQSSV